MSFRIASIACKVTRLPLGVKGNPWISAFASGVSVAWCRVTAEDGTFGDGVGQVDPTVELIPTIIRQPAFGPRLLGQQFESPEDAYRTVRAGPRGRDWQAAMLSALGVVDVALWDLWGKMHGLPLFAMLGGRRVAVPAYASWGLGRTPVDELLACYDEQIHARGAKVIKTAIGNLSVEEDVARIAAIREAVGDIGIAIDAQAQWPVATARRAAAALAPYSPYWIEEPTVASRHGDIMIAADGVVPVATGENLLEVEDFRELLAAGFRGHLQPDPIRIGGITPLNTILQMANAYHVPVAPHCYREISMHAVASARAGGIVEYLGLQEVVHDAIYVKAPTPKDGMLALPDGPGLGFVVDPERFASAAEEIDSVSMHA